MERSVRSPLLVVVLVLALLVPASTAAVPAATPPAPSDGELSGPIRTAAGVTTGVDAVQRTSESNASDVAVGASRTVTFDRTPDELGTVTATLEFEMSADARVMYVYTDYGTMVESATEGFELDHQESDGDRVYKWTDEETSRPTLTLTLTTNHSSGRFSGYNYVETADWALIRHDFDWQYYDADERSWEASWQQSPKMENTYEATGPAYFGQRMVFLGPHQVYERSVEGQTFHLVVPDAATPRESPEKILDTFASAASQLTVGARDGDVNVFVAPDPIRGGGRSIGSSNPEQHDVWIHQSARIGALNTWVHEYVHSRQTYRVTAEMEWFDEGIADYYESLLSLRQGHSTFDEFSSVLSRTAPESVVLSDESTWQSNRGDYVKGRRVLAALDAKIRNASDGERSLQYVFRRMNEQDGAVSYDDFAGYVEEAAGEPMDDWLDTYVGTTARVEVPDNRQSFTSLGGRVDTDGDGLRDSREESLGTDPFSKDSDGDGLGDGREVKEVGTDPETADTDDDGLTDGRELELGTDPTAADSDGDGLVDGREERLGTNPTAADSDGDGLADGREVHELGSDPTVANTDGDSLPDGREVEVGTDPTTWDTDGDGLGDGEELDAGTDPTTADTDGDGIDDKGDPAPTDPDRPTTTATTTPLPTTDQRQTATGGGGRDAPSDGGNRAVDFGEQTPGFGPVAALVALSLAAALARRRRH